MHKTIEFHSLIINVLLKRLELIEINLLTPIYGKMMQIVIVKLVGIIPNLDVLSTKISLV